MQIVVGGWSGKVARSVAEEDAALIVMLKLFACQADGSIFPKMSVIDRQYCGCSDISVF